MIIINFMILKMESQNSEPMFSFFHKNKVYISTQLFFCLATINYSIYHLF
jgi:hypothetical protein